MAREGIERRLTTIMSADVVGYSRLMAADEAGTFAQLKTHRREVIEPKATEHHGRVVKLTGDGTLMEFTSVVDAVNFAVEVQQAMVERNASVPEDLQIKYRIGINLGEIIVDGEDIYGDGVNIAARLEGLAAPGGIYISGKVYEEVRNKLSIAFEDLGEQEVKNIPEPVRVYRWTDAAADPTPGMAGVEAALPLPDKPSIAVLPFTNMSADADQEYFSDGITEDIITELSRFRSLFVIARNSSFHYKGQSPKVQDIGRELGVQYIVEGSVRKAGNRVRITAQLVEAESGNHLWAERYDRDLDDIFAVQDEVTHAIVTAIEPTLGSAERDRAHRKPTGSLDAWDLFQRGLWHHYRFTKEDNAEAQGFFRQAIAADPGFAQALGAFAHARYWDALFGFAADPNAALAEGLDHARRAVSLDDREPFAHFALGRVQTLRGELDGAVAELERAIELNSNFAHAYFGLGWALMLFGRPADALERIDSALRLNPHDPAIWTFLAGRALALFFLDRLDEAADWARRSAQCVTTGFWAHGFEAAVLGHLGREREAAAALAEAYRLKPDFSADFVRQILPFRIPEHRQRFLDGLAKAGLEE